MYYNLEKTAEILDCTPGDVNRLREANKLRAFRDGASWKFRKEDVEKYLTDLIRERSKPATGDDVSGLLNDSDEEELPTMLADSSSFDAMIDATAETLEIKTNDAEEPDFALDDSVATDEEDLQIVAEPQAEAPAEDDADFGLALDVETDELQIVDEAEQAEPEVEVEADQLLAADDASKADDESASVFSLDQDDADALSSSSDDDLLHLGSDSGLSLLDDVDLSGSNVSLDGGDVVLGGSGSGSGLHLGSDSGLSLLGDDAEDFALDGGVELQNDAAFAPDADDDDSIFELADEPKPAAVLELEQNADSDTATILGSGAEDFQLASDESSTYDVSESESASQVIAVAQDDEDDPFFTKDGDDDGDSNPFELPADDSSNAFGDFGAAASDASNPFASAVETSDAGFGGFDSTDDGSGFGGDGFGGGSFDSTDDAGFVSDAEAAPIAARAPQTEYAGKDFLFLVPCFICVLLATIGAYELCRTIWSYEEAAFDLSGPMLDMIANALSLTK